MSSDKPLSTSQTNANDDDISCEPCEDISCESCEVSEKRTKATKYCKECDERLCDSCTTTHSSSKATKLHEPTDIEIKETPNKIDCEPCESSGKTQDAVQFCNECEEYLCGECTSVHKTMKATKMHVPMPIATVNNETYLDGKTQDSDKTEEKSKTDTEIDEGQTAEISKNPGKPSATDVGADFIILAWSKPLEFGSDDYYQVSYKDIEKQSKWKMSPVEPDMETTTVTDLKSNTKYIFRVRVVYDHGEGPYSPTSETITTATPPATHIVEFAKLIEEGKPSPSKYAFPITEWMDARNDQAKTRKFDAGPPPVFECREKTIMLVGATGTGKSTLVDGIINYATGVNWNDPFRFTIIDLEEEEKNRQKNQALSQTEWITCYSINPDSGSRLPYRLNIIDTPGFGDTRGLQRDGEIVEQIRQLFSNGAPKGVSCIDAVCFLIKAPDARLTAVQRYIFQSVMSLFGKDIENNICSLVTFADGLDPPVMAALKESGLPFGETFTFNNSGLFAKNLDIPKSSLSPMFWDMGMKSFHDFFSYIDKQVETKSLQLTKDVLDERFRLEATVKNLQPHLDNGLKKVSQMKQEIKIIEENKSTIEANKNFVYTVKETKQKKDPLPKGEHVTNCLNCNFTCHKNCGIPNDADKSKCAAMKNGMCTACPDKCHWQKHANTPYKFTYPTAIITKTYADMEKKYRAASGKLPTMEQVVQHLGEELDSLCDDIEDLMTIVKECNERLSEIALRPNPLTMTEHIDLMIKNEELEKKDGFVERIASLQQFRHRAEIVTHVEHFNKEARSTLVAAGRKKKTDAKSLWQRIGKWFKSVD